MNSPRHVIIIGAARSGTKMLRDALAAATGAGTVPYDVGYVWRYGNERAPDDALLPDQLSERSRRFIARFVDRYAAGPGPTVIEKTVGNSMRVPFVAAAFPDARYIHLIRDGVDVAESSRRQWSADTDWKYILSKARHVPLRVAARTSGRYSSSLAAHLRVPARRLGSWGVRYPGIEADLATEDLLVVCARQWRESVLSASRAFQALKVPVFEVRYEDLVLDPFVSLRKLTEFVELPAPAQDVEQAAAAITKDRLGCGRGAVSAADLDRLRPEIERTLVDLGYDGFPSRGNQVEAEKPVAFALPDIGDDEIDAVVEVLRSGWLTTGEQCRRFEDEFAAAVEAGFAVAVNSCTAALHLALEAVGVGPGDLVFLSPYTFAASAEVVRYLGAEPVFVDIDPHTLNISPAKLGEAVEAGLRMGRGRPRAVIPVHIAGVPCAMDEIWGLARKHDLAVVEDAAHAFPSAYRGRPVGSRPTDVRGATCFSFYATKTITTGEGGMLTTDDEPTADRARSMSLHGLSRPAWSRYSGGTWSYDITAPGYKYNLTDIAAALGRVQLRRASDMTSRRAEIAAAYDTAFGDIEALECPTVPMTADSAWHLYIYD